MVGPLAERVRSHSPCIVSRRTLVRARHTIGLSRSGRIVAQRRAVIPLESDRTELLSSPRDAPITEMAPPQRGVCEHFTARYPLGAAGLG